MNLYENWIPSIFFVEAQLVAVPGINLDSLAQYVINNIANTIIHEAVHGARWAEQYLPGNLDLKNINQQEEERIAEQAENRANLNINPKDDVFDPSQESEDIMSKDRLLDAAVQKANSSGEVMIPREAVEDQSLDPSAQGLFEMIQGPDLNLQNTSNPHIAWSDNDRKLYVDIDKIINLYNQMQTNMPATYQDARDGAIEPDIPGVSQQPPISGSIPATPSVPSVQGVPSR